MVATSKIYSFWTRFNGRSPTLKREELILLEKTEKKRKEISNNNNPVLFLKNNTR